MAGKKIDAFVLPDGTLQVLVNGPLDFEEAAAMSQAILRATGQKVAIAIGTPEQHRDGGKVRHVHVIGGHEARHG